jgi:hypothetical protein
LMYSYRPSISCILHFSIFDVHPHSSECYILSLYCTLYTI